MKKFSVSALCCIAACALTLGGCNVHTVAEESRLPPRQSVCSIENCTSITHHGPFDRDAIHAIQHTTITGIGLDGSGKIRTLVFPSQSRSDEVMQLEGKRLLWVSTDASGQILDWQLIADEEVVPCYLKVTFPHAPKPEPQFACEAQNCVFSCPLTPIVDDEILVYKCPCVEVPPVVTKSVQADNQR